MNNEPINVVGWEIAVQWKQGTTDEQITQAEEFIIELNKDVNGEGEDAVPSCIQAITITRI